MENAKNLTGEQFILTNEKLSVPQEINARRHIDKTVFLITLMRLEGKENLG